jgi:hypothetical protein
VTKGWAINTPAPARPGFRALLVLRSGARLVLASAVLLATVASADVCIPAATPVQTVADVPTLKNRCAGPKSRGDE